jgi:pimeloyl-ACP methyl ester carboxylesterase
MITSPMPTARRPRRTALRSVTFSIAAALVFVACSSDEPAAEPPPATRDVSDVTTTVTSTVSPPSDAPTSSVDSTTTLPPPLDYEIEWEPLGDRVDAGWLTVPLDYADPQGATIDLWVVRHRADADKRIGVLLANNGGPGVAASTIASNATRWVPELTDQFDVVSWDPRGTGITEGAVDCIDGEEYDRFYSSYDVTPDDEDERQALVDIAAEFAQRCIDRVGEPLRYIGTNNTARDMDSIRQALGEPQVSYIGFSYGSELGGVWATLFPETVRAAVFDGGSDPDADLPELVRQQRVALESSFNTFLAECSANGSCAFHNDGQAEAAFDQLMADIDRQPLPSIEGRASVNLEVALTGVLQAMYGDVYWPALERALEDAAAGDGAGLLQLQDLYFRNSDNSYSNLIEAFKAITCADDPARPSVEESDAEATELIGVAPRTYPYTTGSYDCTFFPEALDPRIPITGIGAGPIVVIGTTGDWATPLESGRRLAAALEDGRFVVVEANQHTSYLFNGCVQDVVNEYLIQLEAPETGLVCA